MYLHWNRFKDYCYRNNIQLLKDDIKFLERELIKINPNEHRTILKEYSDLWLHTLKKGEKSSQNQNLARKTANNWLYQEVNVRKAQKAPYRV